jgi:alkyl hydroperoxide reductase subunit AhpC
MTPLEDGGIGELDFPLLSDLTKNVARAYNCLIPEAGVALRATYIIDPEGVLRCY